ALNVPVPVVDLRLLPAGTREAQAFRLAREEAARPFDPRRLPLLRTQLYQFEDTKRIFVLTLHRGIFDHDSLGILLHDLSACYEARRTSAPVSLPALPFQYAEFASDQRQKRVANEADLQWWRTKLAESPAPLRLPSLQPFGAAPAGRCRVERHDLTPALLGSVESLARREGTNAFTIFLAAFQVLLHRYTSRVDFVVGVVASDRRAPETEGLPGPFTKVVPFRANLAGDPTFRGLLDRVRTDLLEAFAHSSAPFEQLADGRSEGAPGGFVRFSHERKLFDAASWPGLKLQELELDSGSSPGEFAFTVVENAGNLSIRAEYDADAFSPAIVQQMLAHFGVLLQSSASRPQSRLSELPLLTLPERRRLFGEWNNTGAEYPRDATVQELFSRRAANAPDDIAVGSPAGKLTYRELEQRSNQFGRHLRLTGVRPGVLVALCLERSAQLAVALLGVLKAGGAALLLDPSLPTPVRTRLMGDAHPELIVTETAWRAALPPTFNRVLLLDAEAADIRRTDDAGLAAVAGPDDPACVVATNGTGAHPRPVEISHRALVSSLHALRRVVRVVPEDVVFATAALSGSDAVLELLLPLIFGARLELTGAADLAAPDRLATLATTAGATLMQAPPSLWEKLLGAGWTGGKSLRILSTGEPLSRELAARLLPCCRELWNVYGATESTGACLAAPVGPGRAPAVIGRPLANVQIHLLDSHLQPVPVGIPGEIFVGGDALAHGYRRQPTLTSEQFIADPFRRLPGARLFRTGDLARRHPNGEIEFLGRLDQQTARRGVVAAGALRPAPARRDFSLPLPRGSNPAFSPLPDPA
ncbi:MAG: amino acid adenylation enzyme/thioester reductase family protein, partial [Verrucomicrobia bacterium]|nr:amino acid adenylation enzyme/thioester reductase family protein [Verrucomicrobiota bacterium]